MYFRIACLTVVLAAACKQSSKPPAAPVVNTAIVIPAVDSAIVTEPYDRVADSLRILHLRDSFYAQAPLLRFGNEKESDALLQLADWCTDTLPVRRTPLQFTEKEETGYNKAQDPTQIKYTYRNPRYTVTLTDTHPYEYSLRQLTVNGNRLRPGIELDTALIGKEWLSHIALDASSFTAIEINKRPWLLMEGGIEKCNGIGCGTRYFILYNPLQNRGVVVRQFRMALLIVGFNKTNQRPELVAMEDADFNYLLQHENCSGALYTINQQGKLQAVKDKYGKPKSFEGYYPMNEWDTCACICIRRHNMQ